MVSGELHLGHLSFTFVLEKARYCLVGTQLRIAFQMKIWIFLGQWSFQIQFHNCLFVGTLACWYKYFEADLTEQMPLL